MYGSIKNIRVVAVFLLILSVALSSMHVFGESKVTPKTVKEKSSKKKSSNEQQSISKHSELEAVVPFFAFDLLKDTYLISKLDFPADLEEEVYHSEPLYTSKYFKTLFCFVISPNAP